MNRGLIAASTAAVLSAGLLGWWFAPEVGPPVSLPPKPIIATEGVRAPTAPVRAPIPIEGISPRDLPPGTPITRTPSPPAPIDPNQVFDVDLKGLASAAVARHEEWQACWNEHLERAGEDSYDGRLTVKITVSPDGDRGQAETEIVNGPEDDAFDACIADVMADVKFVAPDVPFSMMWPLPIR